MLKKEEQEIELKSGFFSGRQITRDWVRILQTSAEPVSSKGNRKTLHCGTNEG
jgi:hypothetical protein